MASDIGENLEFTSIASVVIGGINIIWGFLLIGGVYYLLGLFGIVSAIIDIFIFFYALKIKKLYENKNYEGVRSEIKKIMILGFVFGLIVLGVLLYISYRHIDDIIIKKHLVRAPGEPFYPPPQFPQ